MSLLWGYVRVSTDDQDNSVQNQKEKIADLAAKEGLEIAEVFVDEDVTAGTGRRISSITDVWVMNATIRMGPWQVRHASGSTSTICCRRAAHRRVASVGASRGAETMAGSAVGAGSP